MTNDSDNVIGDPLRTEFEERHHIIPKKEKVAGWLVAIVALPVMALIIFALTLLNA